MLSLLSLFLNPFKDPFLLKPIVSHGCPVRMALARREHGRRKLIRWAGGATTIQRQAPWVGVVGFHSHGAMIFVTGFFQMERLFEDLHQPFYYHSNSDGQ